MDDMLTHFSSSLSSISSESRSMTSMSRVYGCSSCDFQMQGYIALEDIKNLKDNWNGNGAKSFSPKLIGHCYQLLDLLTYNKIGVMAFVVPTANRSIQFQFENDNRYLEFEVNDDWISVYSEDKDNDTCSEYVLSGDSQDYDVVRCVTGFFWRKDLAMKNYSSTKQQALI